MVSMRPYLLGTLGFLIIIKILLLSPSMIEERKSSVAAIDAGRFKIQEHTLAPGIPKDRFPEYTVEKFSHVSVQNGVKQWKINADKAFLFNPEKLVHLSTNQAFLYDQEGRVTQVKGNEAKYFMNQRDLEVFGDVEAKFPDGFILRSEYLRYRPDQKRVEIPNTDDVQGISQLQGSQTFHFTSKGLTYQMNQGKIILPKQVVVVLDEPTKNPSNSTTPSDRTTIESDFCEIERGQQLARFTMYPDRPLSERFVHITQTGLFSRCRKANLRYGDFNQVLHYLTAYDDVLIKEKDKASSPSSEESATSANQAQNSPSDFTGTLSTSKKELRYATAGRADFDNQQNKIILTQFPQVYQNEDTVVGDRILLHRNTDTVEVENSNAFSAGN